MELLIVQLLIVAFLFAYLMGEEAKVNQYPLLIITHEVDVTPPYVWEAFFDKMTAGSESRWAKEDIAGGLNWSARVGPTPAF